MEYRRQLDRVRGGVMKRRCQVHADDYTTVIKLLVRCSSYYRNSAPEDL
jgi:hypothetical protein